MQGKSIIRDSIKYFIRSICIIAISALVCTFLMLLCSFIPQRAMENNAKESVEQLERFIYWNNIVGIKGNGLDIFTDSLIVDTAVFSSGNFKSTIMGERANNSDWDSGAALIDYLNNKTDIEKFEYARYWHGYLIFLRPLLCLKSILSIYSANLVFQLSLVVFSVYLFCKKKRTELIIPFFVFWISLSPVSLIFSLQYSSVFYVTIIAIIMLLVMKKDFYSCWLIFLCSGIAVCFFDLLTYPLVSLGAPLLFFFALDSEAEKKIGLRVLECISYSISWFMGYVGMYICKWAISSAVGHKNIFGEAIGQVLFRTSHSYNEINYDWVTTMKININQLVNQPVLVASVISFFLFFILMSKNRKYKKNNKCSSFIAILIVSLYPCVWYYAVMNHSNIHYFFTYRVLSISLLGGMLALWLNMRKLRLPIKE